MNTWQVAQGVDAAFRVTIVDHDGEPITTYTGAESLAGKVWPGDDRASAFSLAPTWADAANGLVDVLIAASNTEALGVGNYRVQLTLLEGSYERDIYEGVLEVLASPGTAVPGPTYCTYADMLELAPWIGDLQDTMHDETGFSKQRANARVRLDNLILRNYRGHTTGRFGDHSAAGLSWGYGGGPVRSILGSPILRGWLAANYVLVGEQIRRICAHWAIADVCAAQLGRGGAYPSYGAWHRAQGDMLALGTTVELDINSDGISEVGVQLGSTNTLFT